jgi:hypothetical protein
MEPLSIRLATSEDHQALARLAALDSGEVPFRPALVAELEGEIVAVVSLRGGRPLADPFRHTAAIVELLELRARQLTVAEPEVSSRGIFAALGRLVGRDLRHSDAA